MLDTLELTIFVHVASALSFAAGARSLGMTASAVSKAVVRLESRLGAKLLVRTTRSVRLTDIGSAFLERAARIVAELDAAERGAQSDAPTARGRLQLELPLTLGARQIVPLLAPFSARYPELQLDVRLDDRYADLVRGDADAAVRVGALDDSRLVARKLAISRVVTIAAPGFLKTQPRRRAPEDLPGPHCLSFRSANSGRVLAWRFLRGARRVSFSPASVHTFSNSEALVAAAAAGLGVAQVLDFAAAEELARGSVVALFPELAAVGPPISLVCVPEQAPLPKLRALFDYFATVFARGAPWQSPQKRSR